MQEATASESERQMMNSFVKDVDVLDFHIRDKQTFCDLSSLQLT